ncbi:MAG: TIGR02452 family protein [Butyrivibrio sp.]|nr:TIGR02452 family protein [Butyrivibrio sp.]
MDKTELRQQRKLAALMHYNLVKEEYSDEIEKSITGSDVFEVRTDLSGKNYGDCGMTPKIYQYSSSQDILYNNPEICTEGRKVCVLNFADTIKPGGGYFKGYTTQEEELCFNSTLLPVLEAFKDSVYEKNRQIDELAEEHPFGIYSPDIIFFNEDGEERVADVITLAAPNVHYLQSRNDIGYYFSMDDEFEFHNNLMCDMRIKDIFYQAVIHGVTDLVLGAWGCGAYGNDPKIIARYMLNCSESYPVQTHFVLTGGKNADVFKSVLEKS